MINAQETNAFSESFPDPNANSRIEETYVMKGFNAEKALETYHFILAPSFACNLRCKHCYLHDHDAGGLPKEEVLRLIEEWSDIVVAERGPMGGILHLKGGEPLMLPYFKDVLAILAELKTLRFMITTNGILGDSHVVERLAQLRQALNGGVQIIVSIDGSNDAINGQLRGPGNFEKAVAFIRLLRRASISVFLNNVIHLGNLDDVEAFVELALELEIQQINFLSFVPRGYGQAMRIGRPSSDKIFERIDAIWKRGNARVRQLLAGSLSDIIHAESCGLLTSGKCVGGYRGLVYVVPDGTTYSCPNLIHPDLEVGNIYSEPFASIHDTLPFSLFPRITESVVHNRDRYLCPGEKQTRKFYGRGYKCHGISGSPFNNHNDSISYCFNRNW